MFLIYGLVRAADFIIIFLSAVVADDIYVPPLDTDIEYWQYRWMAGFIGALLAAGIFHFNGSYAYKPQQIPFGRLRISNLLVSWGSVMIGLLVLAFLFHISGHYSRIWVTLWFAFALLGMTVVRIVRFTIERHWLRQGKLTRKIVIYGSGENAGKLCEALRGSGDYSFRIVGFFDDRRGNDEHDRERRKNNRRDPRLEVETNLGTTKDILVYGRSHQIDQIIVALPW